MAKKKPSTLPPVLGSIVDGLKKSALDLLNRAIHEKIKKIEKITIEIALGLLFFILGLFFLLTAFVFFLNQFAHVSLFLGFFFIGLLALGAASIFYFLIKHN